MDKTPIEAFERNEKPHVTRREGFLPAVIYGAGIEGSIPIKIQFSVMKKLLSRRGKNSKIWVKLGDNVKYTLIKDIARNPLTGNVIHMDLQAIKEDELLKVKVPLAFEGREKLESRGKFLETVVSELEVTGKAKDLPESIIIHVGDKEAGERITVADLQAEKPYKFDDPADKMVAIIAEKRTVAEPEKEEAAEPEEAVSAEPEADKEKEKSED